MRNYVILMLFVFLSIGFTYAETSSSSLNWLTRNFADTLYCQQGGDCNVSTLTAINITETFMNITGNMSITGVICDGNTGLCYSLADLNASTPGDNLGNHNATQTLIMNYYNITDVNSFQDAYAYLHYTFGNFWYDSLNADAQYCYQEFANQATDCGGIGDGVYVDDGGWNNPTNGWDGDYNTLTDVAAGTQYIYINYTIPTYAIAQGTILQGKVGNNGVANQTFDTEAETDCMTTIPDDILRLRIISEVSGPLYISKIDCYDYGDSQWRTLLSDNEIINAAGNDFYELGMFWAVNPTKCFDFYNLSDRRVRICTNGTITALDLFSDEIVVNNITVKGDIIVEGTYQNLTDGKSTVYVVASNTSQNTNNADYLCTGTDDDGCILNAINALPTEGGEIVLLDGVFYFDDHLIIEKDKVKIRGMGIATEIRQTNGGFSTSVRILSADYFILKDLHFVGEESGVELYSGNYNQIIGCYFTNISTQRPLAIGLTAGTFGNIYKDNTFENTIDFYLNNVANTIIANNVFLDIQKKAINILGNDNLIIGNSIYNVNDSPVPVGDGFGIQINGNNTMISNNNIKNVSGYGVYVDSGEGTIINSNRISEYNITGIDNEGKNTIIAMNNLKSTTGTTIDDDGSNTTIVGNYPGGASMEIQSAEGEEIKIVPEGVLTMTFYPNHVNATENISSQRYCFHDHNCFDTDNATAWLTADDLANVYHNASGVGAVAGTLTGELASTRHPDASHDGITLNLTEAAGAPGLDIRFNFTNISTFSALVIRYYTSNIFGAYPLIQIWSYGESEWEDYITLGETDSYVIIEFNAYDPDEHIGTGTNDSIVQMRLYKSANGNTNNEYYIDWLALIEGFGVPSGQEVDPESIHTDHLNYTFFNYSSGVLQWIYDGYQLAGQGDSLGNHTAETTLNMDGNNISNVYNVTTTADNNLSYFYYDYYGTINFIGRI